MSDADEQLVREVVRRVVEVLGGQGTVRASGGDGNDHDAERQVGRSGGGESQGADTSLSDATRVWVTARGIAERASGGGTVTLGANEFLTPAARDYAASRGIVVVCEDAVQAAATPRERRVKPAVLTRTLGLVVDRADAKVESALASAARGGVSMVGYAGAACPIVNARAMCDDVSAGELAGGVMIDRYAAAGMVLAGKVRGIRPVQGVSVQAVLAGLRQFDANVLVIGHAACSVYELRSMIDRFAAGRRMGRERTAVLEAVERWEREG
ncbi:MAG TPA: RpiB/LacA/LacB family sugar-phosphate isomerase [Phycisphaerae bacterium]|nr:RpiB/LacA/LacB family sugar-phosphate isomerase [Phycisphaerae bacterium]